MSARAHRTAVRELKPPTWEGSRKAHRSVIYMRARSQRSKNQDEAEDEYIYDDFGMGAEEGNVSPDEEEPRVELRRVRRPSAPQLEYGDIYRGPSDTDEWVYDDDDQLAQCSIQMPTSIGADMQRSEGYFAGDVSEQEASDLDEDIPLCQECSPMRRAEYTEDEMPSGPKGTQTTQTSPHIGDPSTREQASQWSTPEAESESQPALRCELCWCEACNRPSGLCSICPPTKEMIGATEQEIYCGPFSLSPDCVGRTEKPCKGPYALQSPRGSKLDK